MSKKRNIILWDSQCENEPLWITFREELYNTQLDQLIVENLDEKLVWNIIQYFNEYAFGDDNRLQVANDVIKYLENKFGNEKKGE